MHQHSDFVAWWTEVGAELPAQEQIRASKAAWDAGFAAGVQDAVRRMADALEGELAELMSETQQQPQPAPQPEDTARGN